MLRWKCPADSWHCRAAIRGEAGLSLSAWCLKLSIITFPACSPTASSHPSQTRPGASHLLTASAIWNFTRCSQSTSKSSRKISDHSAGKLLPSFLNANGHLFLYHLYCTLISYLYVCIIFFYEIRSSWRLKTVS